MGLEDVDLRLLWIRPRFLCEGGRLESYSPRCLSGECHVVVCFRVRVHRASGDGTLGLNISRLPRIRGIVIGIAGTNLPFTVDKKLGELHSWPNLCHHDAVLICPPVACELAPAADCHSFLGMGCIRHRGFLAAGVFPTEGQRLPQVVVAFPDRYRDWSGPTAPLLITLLCAMKSCER